MASKLSQKWITIFCQKPQNFVYLFIIRFCLSFVSMWSRHLSNNVWRDSRLPMPASVMVLHKMPNRKINFCSKFAIETLLCYRYKCWHRKSKVSINYLICIWTTCWWNLNQIIWSKMCKILSFINKNRILKNHFCQNVKAILQDGPVAETIV